MPLADIGGEVSEYTEENIRKAIAKINTEIAVRQACVENASAKCSSSEKNRKRLAYLRSEEAVAREVFKLIGDGIIPTTKSGSWMDSHKFRAHPARYKTKYRQSIFVLALFNYFTISPTVNLYGTSFGTDKIAHFFQQGYTYYRIYERALAHGVTPDEASKKAVRWGRKSENTYYGTMVGGVFSNADMFANYAGMRFYQGLTKETRIGKIERPATVDLKKGIWIFNEAKELLLKPFMTDHMNEALNPSSFIPGLRSSIRGIVRKQSCPQWRALYPDRTKRDFEETTASLALWHGEDYGFKKSEKFVTIANTCFFAEARASARAE
ncbi:MAG: hypothetical protein H7070_07360 [Saprospiraceae bacterium]|nr:hypothetical protein [Pyrinomonadaceae bacterium]